jgi:hypothetical protein
MKTSKSTQNIHSRKLLNNVNDVKSSAGSQRPSSNGYTMYQTKSSSKTRQKLQEAWAKDMISMEVLPLDDEAKNYNYDPFPSNAENESTLLYNSTFPSNHNETFQSNDRKRRGTPSRNRPRTPLQFASILNIAGLRYSDVDMRAFREYKNTKLVSVSFNDAFEFRRYSCFYF